MSNGSHRSLFIEVAAYLLVAAVITFFAAELQILRADLASHRDYVRLERDPRWEKIFKRIIEHIDREEALFEHR